MKKVDIAMATYNGEKYVAEQILSLQKQTYSNWHLYISDDGSSDQTIAIIQQLAATDSRISIVNTKKQGGVLTNFNCVLMATTSDYVLLCDQDDVWLEDKIEKLVRIIEEQEKQHPNIPHMIFSDLTLVDKQLHIIAPSFYKQNNIDPMLNMKGYNLLWRSSIYGCSTIVNRHALNLALPLPKDALMHDQWLSWIAYQKGKLTYYDEPTILYRQHDSNAIGGTNQSFSLKIKSIIRNFNNLKKNVSKIKSYLSREKGLYYKNRFFENQKDYEYFAKKEIYPYIFIKGKRLQVIIIYCIFMGYL